LSLDHVPEYFAKPGVTEALSKAHPVLLVRQMANEILRLRSARPEVGGSWGDCLDASIMAATGSILSPYAAEKIRGYARELLAAQRPPQKSGDGH
jgi:hypothetical protein